MQGLTSPTAGAARSVALALFGVALALPSPGRAQDYGPFVCTAGADDIDAVLERHLAEHLPLREHVRGQRLIRGEAWRALRAARRGEVPVSPATLEALETRHAVAQDAQRVSDHLYRSWDLCRDELRRLRRYLPRAVPHVRMTLGFDGGVWSLPNRDFDAAVDHYDRVRYRAPALALQVGWERFYRKRLGVQVNGTLAIGQGRLRACEEGIIFECYGRPQAGGALTVAVDVGLRVWAAPVLVLGLAAELRVTRLPITERLQHGYRYSVSDRVVPAALARLSAEVFLSPDGRWWLSPSAGVGPTLTQRGLVFAVALQLGHAL
jgi:hypothetical protein